MHYIKQSKALRDIEDLRYICPCVSVRVAAVGPAAGRQQGSAGAAHSAAAADASQHHLCYLHVSNSYIMY